MFSFSSTVSSFNEGLVRFDIVFYVRMKDGLSQIILNVEAQKKEPVGYELLNRAVFYVMVLIKGFPSINGTTVFGSIPLNSLTVFTSIYASIIFCPNRRFRSMMLYKKVN